MEKQALKVEMTQSISEPSGNCGRCHIYFLSPIRVKLLQLEYVLLAIGYLVHGEENIFKIEGNTHILPVSKTII